MNKDWQEKLASFGANIDAEGNVSFAGEPSASSAQIAGHKHYDLPLLVELSRLAVIEMTGADAQTFLQDQVCNELALLSENDVQINGNCTPKGRLLALFTVFKHEDGYRLLLPDDVAEAFAKRMQMFAGLPMKGPDGKPKRVQVTINIRADLICSGLVFDSGKAADTVQFPVGIPPLPIAELQISTSEQMQIVRWHDAPADLPTVTANQLIQHRYICVADPDAMSALWQDDAFRRASWSYWRWGDINAGIPSVFAVSAEKFIPQMLNMQLINALSFKIGCYPGQEIVARMQYLGKLKKHMKHLRVPGATAVASPGDVLTTDSNNNAGQVVDAVIDEAGLNLLAVVNIETAVNELKLADLAVVDAPLPYSLIPAKNEAS